MSFGRLGDGSKLGLTRLDLEVQNDLYSDRQKIELRIGVVMSRDATPEEMALMVGQKVTESLMQMFAVSKNTESRYPLPLGSRKLILD